MPGPNEVGPGPVIEGQETTVVESEDGQRFVIPTATAQALQGNLGASQDQLVSDTARTIALSEEAGISAEDVRGTPGGLVGAGDVSGGFAQPGPGLQAQDVFAPPEQPLLATNEDEIPAGATPAPADGIVTDFRTFDPGIVPSRPESQGGAVRGRQRPATASGPSSNVTNEQRQKDETADINALLGVGGDADAATFSVDPGGVGIVDPNFPNLPFDLGAPEAGPGRRGGAGGPRMTTTVTMEEFISGHVPPELEAERSTLAELAIQQKDDLVNNLSTRDAQLSAVHADTARAMLEDEQIMQGIVDESFQKMRGYWEEVQALNREVSAREIDPNRFFSSRGSGARIGASIAVALGEFGRGLTGVGSNAALSIIDNAIARDIDAQKANIINARAGVTTARNILGDLIRITGDETKARAMLTDMHRQRALEDIEARKLRSSSDAERQAWEIMQTQMRQAQNQARIEAARATGAVHISETISSVRQVSQRNLDAEMALRRLVSREGPGALEQAGVEAAAAQPRRARRGGGTGTTTGQAQTLEERQRPARTTAVGSDQVQSYSPRDSVAGFEGSMVRRHLSDVSVSRDSQGRPLPPNNIHLTRLLSMNEDNMSVQRTWTPGPNSTATNTAGEDVYVFHDFRRVPDFLTRPEQAIALSNRAQTVLNHRFNEEAMAVVNSSPASKRAFEEMKTKVAQIKDIMESLQRLAARTESEDFFESLGISGGENISFTRFNQILLARGLGLGALNGPDLELVESLVPNINSFDMRDDAAASLRATSNLIGREAASLIQSRGGVPTRRLGLQNAVRNSRARIAP